MVSIPNLVRLYTTKIFEMNSVKVDFYRSGSL